MRIRVQTFVNNEVRITCGSDLYQPPKMSDKSTEKKIEAYAVAHQQYINNKKAIKHLWETSAVTQRIVVSDGYQLRIDGGKDSIGSHQVEYKTLPKEYKVVEETPDGRLIVSKRDVSELLNRARSSLDLISKSQQKVEKHSNYGAQQKPKAFTKNARHKLLECGEAVDKLGYTKTSSMLTLTLPGGTREAKDALARWSGWFVNRQLNIIRRHPRGSEIYWFFVWENQSRGALHQHWCIASPDYELSKEVAMQVRRCWFDLMFEIEFKEGIDMFEREGKKGTWMFSPDKWIWDEQKIQKSVGKYFAKYASKNISADKKGENNNRINQSYPSRWFGSSSNLKAVCKQWKIDFSIVNIPKDEVEYLRSIVLDLVGQYNIIRKYEYEYEAVDPKTERVLNSGEVQILYVDVDKFSDCFSELREQLATDRKGCTVKSAFHWHLQFCREVNRPKGEFQPRLGEYQVFV